MIAAGRASDPGNPMRIHVCIRATLDWQDRAAVEAGLIPAFRPKYDAWNATFDMPYHRFRHRVCEIARLALSRVEGVVSSTLNAVPSGDVLVPVDDDDWLAPDLAVHLGRAAAPGVRGYLWTRALIEPPNRVRAPLRTLARWLGRRDRVICKTNNYAVVKDAELLPLAGNHLTASRYFLTHPADIRRIPGVLAIQNRTLASQTALAWDRPSITPAEILAAFRRYRRLYRSWRVGPELRWAEPYVLAMAALMEELHPR